MGGPAKNRNLHRPKQIRVFECPVCGFRQTCAKWKNKTAPGHVKDLYCPVCRKVREYIQIE